MVDVVKFKFLIQLRLVNVPIDDEVIMYLTTSCPLLQTCHIINCNGFNSFCVYGHQNLSTVWVDFNAPVERIHVEPPNLSDLWITNWDGRGWALRMNVASCKKLISVCYIGYPLPNSNDFLSNFPFIENYNLITPSEGNNLKLSSYSLRTLMLHSLCDLEDIELSTPNLDLFVYSCKPLDLSIVRHLTYLKASMLYYPRDSVDALWFHKLRLFLGKKNGFKALNWYICATQEFTELEKLKAIELPPYELEHVELQLDYHDESLAHIAFVDAVLWCCRPRSLTLISSFPLTNLEEQSDVFMFTYEKLLQQEDQGHTNIKIVSHSSFSSLLMPLPRKGKAISFIKEEVL